MVDTGHRAPSSEPRRRVLRPGSLPPVDWRALGRRAASPPVVLLLVLLAFALVTHGLLAEAPRFGAGLQGGRLLPASGLAQTWSDYLASWHPAAGGTGSPAPASLLVLALAGTVLAPAGGPPTAVALLLLLAIPASGMTAYAATGGSRISPRWRAVASGAYALLPEAALSAAHGQLDVVVTQILLPPLLAGLAAVVGLRPVRSWFGAACRLAIGLAVLGAFAPLMLVGLIVLALVGFVLVPGDPSRPRRRVAGMAIVVLLPIACLLPWPVVLAENPSALLHGPGLVAGTPEAGPAAALLALSPDGSPASALGVLLVLAAGIVAIAAPARRMIPGAVVALVGWVLAVLVHLLAVEPLGGGPSVAGWTGAPLVLVAAGLLWVVFEAGPLRSRPLGLSRLGLPRLGSLPSPRSPQRAVQSAAVVSLVVLAVAAAIAGSGGPLRAQPLAAGPAGEVTLGVEPDPWPASLMRDPQPRFGDADLVPAGGAAESFRALNRDLRSHDPQRVRGALAASAARGAGLVSVPNREAEGLRAAAGGLLAERGPLPGGRSLLRVQLPSSPVQLLGPDLARQARLQPAPNPEGRPLVVGAAPPNVTLRASDGGAGRVLLLGAENEAGWHARIDGRTAPITTAWGHQVAVPLPEHASEVSVSYTTLPRTILVALQAAAILFAAVGALPEGIRRPRPPGAAALGKRLRRSR